jgi:hypothetical protein
MHWPRGKVLGGSSSINHVIYMRGHRDNYDQWRDFGVGPADELRALGLSVTLDLPGVGKNLIAERAADLILS